MDQEVQRTRHETGRDRGRDGETTLAQTFQFGPGITAAAVAEVMRSAPLVGDDSIFGDRPGDEVETGGASRRLLGFSPVPGFRFDVELAEREQGVFVASFSQPDRSTPYLAGDALWLLSDQDGGAVFDEEINTEPARSAGVTSLSGQRPSLRRWLFFRVGHARVMGDATERIARLTGSA